MNFVGTQQAMSPEAVVQLRGINRHQGIAQMFEHPSKLLASGSAALRERFLARFKEPNLYAQLLKRVVMGNTVIDHERVTRTFPDGTGTVELVMIYEIQNQKIAKAWVIAGAAKLDNAAKTA
jgi:hypothetical protein